MQYTVQHNVCKQVLFLSFPAAGLSPLSTTNLMTTMTAKSKSQIPILYQLKSLIRSVVPFKKRLAQWKSDSFYPLEPLKTLALCNRDWLYNDMLQVSETWVSEVRLQNNTLWRQCSVVATNQTTKFGSQVATTTDYRRFGSLLRFSGAGLDFGSGKSFLGWQSIKEGGMRWREGSLNSAALSHIESWKPEAFDQTGSSISYCRINWLWKPQLPCSSV